MSGDDKVIREGGSKPDPAATPEKGKDPDRFSVPKEPKNNEPKHGDHRTDK